MNEWQCLQNSQIAEEDGLGLNDKERVDLNNKTLDCYYKWIAIINDR